MRSKKKNKKQRCGNEYYSQLLHNHITAFNKRMQCIKENKSYTSYDCLYPCIYDLEHGTFEDNLRNMFAQINNAYLSGMHAAAQFFLTEKKLTELKRNIALLYKQMQ